jgi:hypothetical protein
MFAMAWHAIRFKKFNGSVKERLHTACWRYRCTDKERVVGTCRDPGEQQQNSATDA